MPEQGGVVMYCCHVVSKQGDQAGDGNWHAFHYSHTQHNFVSLFQEFVLLSPKLASLVYQHFKSLTD